MKALIHSMIGSRLRGYRWYRRWQGIPEPEPLCTAALVAKESLRILEGKLVFHPDVYALMSNPVAPERFVKFLRRRAL